jgi:hypothetical protein
VAILSLMETSETLAQAQCERRMGGGCEQLTINDYEVEKLQVQCEPRKGGGCDHGWIIDFVYEVEKPPGQYPIGGPRVVSVMKVEEEEDFRRQVQCEPHVGGGCEQ